MAALLRGRGPEARARRCRNHGTICSLCGSRCPPVFLHVDAAPGFPGFLLSVSLSLFLPALGLALAPWPAWGDWQAGTGSPRKQGQSCRAGLTCPRGMLPGPVLPSALCPPPYPQAHTVSGSGSPLAWHGSAMCRQPRVFFTCGFVWVKLHAPVPPNPISASQLRLYLTSAPSPCPLLGRWLSQLCVDIVLFHFQKTIMTCTTGRWSPTQTSGRSSGNSAALSPLGCMMR